MSAKTGTVYSSEFDRAWGEFVDLNPELKTDDGLRAYLAGWTSMYSALSARAK